MFWIKSEPFLGRIRTQSFSCPAPRGGTEIRGPAPQDRQAGKNSFPLKPLSFSPARLGRAGENLKCFVLPLPRPSRARATNKVIHSQVYNILFWDILQEDIEYKYYE